MPRERRDLVLLLENRGPDTGGLHFRGARWKESVSLHYFKLDNNTLNYEKCNEIDCFPVNVFTLRHKYVQVTSFQI